MIWQIIRREILENILSLRFMLSLLLVIVLFAVSGFVFGLNWKLMILLVLQLLIGHPLTKELYYTVMQSQQSQVVVPV